ncbi:unnamed protein product [Caenorhabditis bovis]|uniref:Uncharacterized protein n=1 Tax=Caenorhabditis bovis TaxID=2654633 RepID=A0A8S1ELG8_9PELO|nr:unnamed protein product [Caenorhabditis bovis]
MLHIANLKKKSVTPPLSRAMHLYNVSRVCAIVKEMENPCTDRDNDLFPNMPFPTATLFNKNFSPLNQVTYSSMDAIVPDPMFDKKFSDFEIMANNLDVELKKRKTTDVESSDKVKYANDYQLAIQLSKQLNGDDHMAIHQEGPIQSNFESFDASPTIVGNDKGKNRFISSLPTSSVSHTNSENRDAAKNQALQLSKKLNGNKFDATTHQEIPKITSCGRSRKEKRICEARLHIDNLHPNCPLPPVSFETHSNNVNYIKSLNLDLLETFPTVSSLFIPNMNKDFLNLTTSVTFCSVTQVTSSDQHLSGIQPMPHSNNIDFCGSPAEQNMNIADGNSTNSVHPTVDCRRTSEKTKYCLTSGNTTQSENSECRLDNETPSCLVPINTSSTTIEEVCHTDTLGLKETEESRNEKVHEREKNQKDPLPNVLNSLKMRSKYELFLIQFAVESALKEKNCDGLNGIIAEQPSLSVPHHNTTSAKIRSVREPENNFVDKAKPHEQMVLDVPGFSHEIFCRSKSSSMSPCGPHISSTNTDEVIEIPQCTENLESESVEQASEHQHPFDDIIVELPPTMNMDENNLDIDANMVKDSEQTVSPQSESPKLARRNNSSDCFVDTSVNTILSKNSNSPSQPQIDSSINTPEVVTKSSTTETTFATIMGNATLTPAAIESDPKQKLMNRESNVNLVTLGRTHEAQREPKKALMSRVPVDMKKIREMLPARVPNMTWNDVANLCGYRDNGGKNAKAECPKEKVIPKQSKTKRSTSAKNSTTKTTRRAAKKAAPRPASRPVTRAVTRAAARALAANEVVAETTTANDTTASRAATRARTMAIKTSAETGAISNSQSTAVREVSADTGATATSRTTSGTEVIHSYRAEAVMEPSAATEPPTGIVTATRPTYDSGVTSATRAADSSKVIDSNGATSATHENVITNPLVMSRLELVRQVGYPYVQLKYSSKCPEIKVDPKNSQRSYELLQSDSSIMTSRTTDFPNTITGSNIGSTFAIQPLADTETMDPTHPTTGTKAVDTTQATAGSKATCTNGNTNNVEATDSVQVTAGSGGSSTIGTTAVIETPDATQLSTSHESADFVRPTASTEAMDATQDTFISGATTTMETTSGDEAADATQATAASGGSSTIGTTAVIETPDATQVSTNHELADSVRTTASTEAIDATPDTSGSGTTSTMETIPGAEATVAIRATDVTKASFTIGSTAGTDTPNATQVPTSNEIADPVRPAASTEVVDATQDTSGSETTSTMKTISGAESSVAILATAATEAAALSEISAVTEASTFVTISTTMKNASAEDNDATRSVAGDETTTATQDIVANGTVSAGTNISGTSATALKAIKDRTSRTEMPKNRNKFPTEAPTLPCPKVIRQSGLSSGHPKYNSSESSEAKVSVKHSQCSTSLHQSKFEVRLTTSKADSHTIATTDGGTEVTSTVRPRPFSREITSNSTKITTASEATGSRAQNLATNTDTNTSSTDGAKVTSTARTRPFIQANFAISTTENKKRKTDHFGRTNSNNLGKSLVAQYDKTKNQLAHMETAKNRGENLTTNVPNLSWLDVVRQSGFPYVVLHNNATQQVPQLPKINSVSRKVYFVNVKQDQRKALPEPWYTGRESPHVYEPAQKTTVGLEKSQQINTHVEPEPVERKLLEVLGDITIGGSNIPRKRQNSELACNGDLIKKTKLDDRSAANSTDFQKTQD